MPLDRTAEHFTLFQVPTQRGPDRHEKHRTKRKKTDDFIGTGVKMAISIRNVKRVRNCLSRRRLAAIPPLLTGREANTSLIFPTFFSDLRLYREFAVFGDRKTEPTDHFYRLLPFA